MLHDRLIARFKYYGRCAEGQPAIRLGIACKYNDRLEASKSTTCGCFKLLICRIQMQIVTYVRFCQIKIFCAAAVSNCLGGRGFVYRDDLTISSVAIRYRYYRRRASKLATDWTEFDDITVAHGDSNFLRAVMCGLWVGSLSTN